MSDFDLAESIWSHWSQSSKCQRAGWWSVCSFAWTRHWTMAAAVFYITTICIHSWTLSTSILIGYSSRIMHSHWFLAIKIYFGDHSGHVLQLLWPSCSPKHKPNRAFIERFGEVYSHAISRKCERLSRQRHFTPCRPIVESMQLDICCASTSYKGF